MMGEKPPVGPQIRHIQALHPERRRYSGKFVMLRPVDPEKDAHPLFAASHGSDAHEKIWTYMGYGPFAGPDDMQVWLKQQAEKADPLFLTVCNRSSERPLGMVSFLNILPDMRRMEVGHIWYGLEAQRTKVNTETIYLMLRAAFDDWHYRRVEWKCDSLNARSRAAAERLGFRYEGLFRQHMIVKGRSRDTTWFAMIDHEWPRIRDAIESWLYDPSIEVSLGELTG